jgi:hypothetical protein
MAPTTVRRGPRASTVPRTSSRPECKTVWATAWWVSWKKTTSTRPEPSSRVTKMILLPEGMGGVWVEARIGAAVAVPLDPLDSRVLTLDLAGAPGTGQARDDGVLVPTQSVDQRVQGGEVIAFDAVHPGREVVAGQVPHHGGEVANMAGDRIQFGAAGADLLEAEGVVGGQVARVRHDPPDDAAGPRSNPGRRRHDSGGLEGAQVAQCGHRPSAARARACFVTWPTVRSTNSTTTPARCG